MIELPVPVHTGRMSSETAMSCRVFPYTFSGELLTFREVAQLVLAAQGESGLDRKRTAHSAGALSPLEIYLAVGNVTGLAPGDPGPTALNRCCWVTGAVNSQTPP